MSKPKRLWANTHWEVADDGLASLGDVEYFIPRDRLCELRPGEEANGVVSWPLQIAAKNWADLGSFEEAFQMALELLKPAGLEAINLSLSVARAREISTETLGLKLANSKGEEIEH
jgi:hypothetical protein